MKTTARIAAALFLAALALPAIAAYPAPTTHLRFDETEGVTAADSAGPHNCELVGDFTWDPAGVNGGCIDFPGTAASAIGTLTGFPATHGDTAVSYCMWVYHRSLGEQSNGHFIARNQSSTQFGLKAFANRYTSTINGDSFVQDSSVPFQTRYALNTWRHLAVVYDGAVHRLYVNGSLDSWTAETRPLGGTAASLTVGNTSTGTAAMNGKLDNVMIWRGKALTAEQVAELYAEQVEAAPILGVPSLTSADLAAPLPAEKINTFRVTLASGDRLRGGGMHGTQLWGNRYPAGRFVESANYAAERAADAGNVAAGASHGLVVEDVVIWGTGEVSDHPQNGHPWEVSRADAFDVVRLCGLDTIMRHVIVNHGSGWGIRVGGGSTAAEGPEHPADGLRTLLEDVQVSRCFGGGIELYGDRGGTARNIAVDGIRANSVQGLGAAIWVNGAHWHGSMWHLYGAPTGVIVDGPHCDLTLLQSENNGRGLVVNAGPTRIDTYRSYSNSISHVELNAQAAADGLLISASGSSTGIIVNAGAEGSRIHGRVVVTGAAKALVLNCDRVTADLLVDGGNPAVVIDSAVNDCDLDIKLAGVAQGVVINNLGERNRISVTGNQSAAAAVRLNVAPHASNVITYNGAAVLPNWTPGNLAAPIPVGVNTVTLVPIGQIHYLRGVHPADSIIRAASDASGAVISTPNWNTGGAAGFFLRRFTVDGGGLAVDGIRLAGQNPRIADVRVTNCGGAGIRATRNGAGGSMRGPFSVENTTVARCVVDDCPVGFDLGSVDGVAHDSTASGCRDAGFSFSANGWNLEELTAENCGTGFRFQAAGANYAGRLKATGCGEGVFSNSVANQIRYFRSTANGVGIHSDGGLLLAGGYFEVGANQIGIRADSQLNDVRARFALQHATAIGLRPVSAHSKYRITASGPGTAVLVESRNWTNNDLTLFADGCTKGVRITSIGAHNVVRVHSENMADADALEIVGTPDPSNRFFLNGVPR